MGISTIGVVGAGQMGSGIAQVAATAGIEVVLQDVSPDGLTKAKSRIEQSLLKLCEKGKLSAADVNSAKQRIQTTQHLEDLSRADLVIEAASENPQLKYDIFRKLDSICRDEVILSTNTSSISITVIAAQTRRPDRVVGMHFMNPVPLMKLVEVIRGLRTSGATFQAVRSVGEKMGKDCIESKDFPGFVVNRVLMPMINEACYALFEGLASAQDIDNAMKLGTNQPMGPLALADFIGLDTCMAILNVMHEGLGDPKYRPCPLLKQYVAAGLLGKKAGQGFYKYAV
ncbi:MAG: 3-hydroxybutyryl-CoA dehydrogenase [Deltaproteobacteria bacterium]|nr:3-hydroxybutyryl-CoA dehydrogenase [Deltaproteobacteria bacterium]